MTAPANTNNKVTSYKIILFYISWLSKTSSNRFFFSSHSITKDISLEETAKAAEYFLADGLIVTGNATGDPAKPADVKTVKTAVSLPVIVGSGVDYENVQNYLNADALIVGSHFKKEGKWFNGLQEERIKRFVEKISIINKQ